MPYTVNWLEHALDDLALLWMAAPDRRAVKVAADRIQNLLRTRTHRSGEVAGIRYSLVVEPLLAFYTVSPDDYQVTVEQVRVFG